MTVAIAVTGVTDGGTPGDYKYTVTYDITGTTDLSASEVLVIDAVAPDGAAVAVSGPITPILIEHPNEVIYKPGMTGFDVFAGTLTLTRYSDNGHAHTINQRANWTATGSASDDWTYSPLFGGSNFALGEFSRAARNLGLLLFQLGWDLHIPGTSGFGYGILREVLSQQDASGFVPTGVVNALTWNAIRDADTRAVTYQDSPQTGSGPAAYAED